MKKESFLLMFILILGAAFLAGCSSEDLGPEEVYSEYWDACSNGGITRAENYLSEKAKEKAQLFGVCGFTHDAINVVEAAQGNPARTFSTDPKLGITENVATLTWVDDQGNLAIVFFALENGEWKINDARWSN